MKVYIIWRKIIMGKEPGILKILVIVGVTILMALGAVYLINPDLIFPARVTGGTGGTGGTGTTGDGKLELLNTADPTYCPTQTGCDSSTYTITCNSVSDPAGLAVTPTAPTEDVTCGPTEVVVRNTGDGVIPKISFSVWSSDPNKVKGKTTIESSKWTSDDRSAGTFRNLDKNEDITIRTFCKYEGGQTDAATKYDLKVTGVADRAKEGYETVTWDVNCTA